MYGWRLEQEVALRKSRGVGMTDEQVRKFVDGCMKNSTILYMADDGQIILLMSFIRRRYARVFFSTITAQKKILAVNCAS